MSVEASPPPDVDAADAADVSDAPPDARFVPKTVNAEPIFTGPDRQRTPPTWNAHLPKLVGDDTFLYAAHTHFPDATDARFAVIMRRARSGGAWTEVARITYPHQPPGLVMDRSQKLHMIFDCLRPGSVDVTCFPGGAGTTGVDSRFYHLIFSSRDGAGALRFDAYANYDEYTAKSNGYQGIGTTADGVTLWSLANDSWGRVIQYRGEDGKSGTITTLTRPDTYLLYPIMASHPVEGSKQLLLYMGEFDPKGGTNAGYPASTGYGGNLSALSEAFRLTPSTLVKPGEVGSYPSDVIWDASGTLYVLSYRVDGASCTELRRFDGGLAAKPKVVSLGCLETYAKMQFARDGTLFVLVSGAAGSGAIMRLGMSLDRGDTFTWSTLTIVGLPSNGDDRWFGATPVKPYTSPKLYDPDRFLFFFSGADASYGAKHSYLGSIALAP